MSESFFIPSIPPLHVNADELTEQDYVVLQTWKPQALLILRNLKLELARRANELSIEGAASVVAISVPFDGDDFWTSQELGSAAKELLGSIADPTLDVIVSVLSGHIKPRFTDSPHPYINATSGRRLPETAKGPGGVLSSYESDRQQWKIHPGTAKLLLWCIIHLKPENYEGVWHLVIPPTMSFLDDHQTYFRLQGVDIVSELLQHVPAEYLKRTGVDGLLISSLRRNMVHLHTPLTPTLLRKSVQTLLGVIDRTTALNSQARFDQLCGLLGDGLIGSVWIYASQEADAIEASLAVLPDVLRALGIGSVRYLKALVPQLVHNLCPIDVQHASVSLQVASLQAMEVVIEVCRPRIYQWRIHIIDGLGRCWVSSMEKPDNKNRLDNLKVALRRVAAALALACPSVVENEYKTLLACDEKMFHTLLSLNG